MEYSKLYLSLLILCIAGCVEPFSWTTAPPAAAQASVSNELSASMLSSAAGLGSTATPMAAVLYDNFEYEVRRSDKNGEVAFKAHGWTDVKANNSYYERGGGFLFTELNPILESRVLVMESRPSTTNVPPGWKFGQTDYYLKFGEDKAPLATIPSNVWIQFWTYATPESRFARRDKTIYPCRGPYPCQRGQMGWLFMWGSAGFETASAPDGGRFLALQGEHADFRGASEYPTNAQKLFQNMSPTPLLAGRWYQVKLHMDMSGEQGIYEAWLRERGASWKKVAEWIGGVTPKFVWPIPVAERVGFRQLAIPTTVNGPDDSTTYMDDFALAGSEEALP